MFFQGSSIRQIASLINFTAFISLLVGSPNSLPADAPFLHGVFLSFATSACRGNGLRDYSISLSRAGLEFMSSGNCNTSSGLETPDGERLALYNTRRTRRSCNLSFLPAAGQVLVGCWGSNTLKHHVDPLPDQFRFSYRYPQGPGMKIGWPSSGV